MASFQRPTSFQTQQRCFGIFRSELGPSRSLCIYFQMLPFRRLAPAFKSCLLSVSRPITSSVHRRAESSPPSTLEIEEDDEEDDFQDILTQRESGPASYRQFLEQIGDEYKFAAPQLWLGDKVVEFVS